MKVCVARRAGFCWGVRRAMDAALETQARFGRHGNVQTLGPLIHNPQALEHLSRRGIQEAPTASSLLDGTVVIRAHGIPLGEYRHLMALRQQGKVRIANGTCPEVARVQSIIRHHSTKGGLTIILGHATHAEVVAHRSYATSGCKVIESLEEARALPDACLEGALVVAQTTFSVSDFRAITGYLRARSARLCIRDTICPDTVQRQKEAADLVTAVDAVVVVGGRNSNNTRHLVELAQKADKPVQWVESVRDLDLDSLKDKSNVGVLAGASTPTWTVDEVVETLEQMGNLSWWRDSGRVVKTLQLPFSLGVGILTALLHHALGWGTGWEGPLLPASLHVAMCAVLPYLDPIGLDREGQMHGHFLSRNQLVLVGFGCLAGAIALWTAALLGPFSVGGVLILPVIGAAYQRLGHTGSAARIRNLPALNDLGQATTPTLLAVLLPGWQHHIPFSQIAAGFIAIFCLAFTVHVIRHLHAFREDRILGREILPVAIGTTATRWVAMVLLICGLGSLAWRIAHPISPIF